MKWNEDSPSPEFRKRVLDAAGGELARNRTSQTRRFWLWQSVAAGGFSVLAGFLLIRPHAKDQAGDESLAMAVDVGGDGTDGEEVDLAMVEELDFYQDLEMWENMSLFENWPEEDA